MANQFISDSLKHAAAVLCIYSPLSAAGESPMLNSMSQLKWDHRVVIVSEPQSTEQTIAAFNQRKAQIDDRDIVWFVNSREQLHSNYSGKPSNDFATALKAIAGDGEQEVVLVGKDGGIKLKADSLDFDRLFTLIDGMPMRIREINSR